MLVTDIGVICGRQVLGVGDDGFGHITHQRTPTSKICQQHSGCYILILLPTFKNPCDQLSFTLILRKLKMF